MKGTNLANKNQAFSYRLIGEPSTTHSRSLIEPIRTRETGNNSKRNTLENTCFTRLTRKPKKNK